MQANRFDDFVSKMEFIPYQWVQFEKGYVTRSEGK